MLDITFDDIRDTRAELVDHVEYSSSLYASIAQATKGGVTVELRPTMKSRDNIANVQNITRLSWNQLQRVPILGVDRFTKMYNLYQVSIDKLFNKYNITKCLNKHNKGMNEDNI